MARRDEDGYYYLADRKSNMIISGGENVYPSEVESLLGSHPKVKDVAVIGVPDDKWGEAVRAVVVLHDGQRATEDELIDWCRNKIAGYKRGDGVRPQRSPLLIEKRCPGPPPGRFCIGCCGSDTAQNLKQRVA